MIMPLPSPLDHSWSLFEESSVLGELNDGDWASLEAPFIAPATLHDAGDGIGRWWCDLADNRLSWSPAVHDLFGIPRGDQADRMRAVGLYEATSRARMERLRAYAIKHRRGFTLDVEVNPATGGRRWVRLIAAPIVANGRTVALRGLKADVSAAYC